MILNKNKYNEIYLIQDQHGYTYSTIENEIQRQCKCNYMNKKHNEKN